MCFSKCEHFHLLKTDKMLKDPNKIHFTDLLEKYSWCMGCSGFIVTGNMNISTNIIVHIFLRDIMTEKTNCILTSR